jgi:hypothetical protein
VHSGSLLRLTSYVAMSYIAIIVAKATIVNYTPLYLRRRRP